MDTVLDVRSDQPSDITIPADRLRTAINDAAVVSLMESIQKIGQQCPITVRWEHAPDQYGDCGELILIAGRHRLEACRRLGIDVNCVVFYGTEAEARMWEIAENLHRAELTALERYEHQAEWIRLAEANEVLRPVDAKPNGGRPEGGIRAASRELGISEPEARRAIKVDSLSPEAKQAARDTGLDRNRTAMIEAAKHAEPAAQVAALQEWAERKRAPREADAFSDGPLKSSPSISADTFMGLVRQYIPAEARETFAVHLENVPINELTHALRTRDASTRRASFLRRDQ